MQLVEPREDAAAALPPANNLKKLAGELRPVLLIIVITGLSLMPLMAGLWLAHRMEVRMTWVVLFGALGLLLMIARWVKVDGQPSAHNPGWKDMARWGLVELTATVVLIGLTILTRFVWSGLAPVWFLLLAYLLIGLLVCALMLVWLLDHRLVVDILAMADLALGPLLIAWLVVSAIQGSVNIADYFLPGAHQRDAQHARVAAARAAQLDAWQGKRMAVMLSGGGYRAALSHAGVLSVIDRAGIPIAALSTVSGGSIIGAAYAAGWTPQEFRNYLAARRPGLPDDILNAINLTASMVWPEWSSGDTYRMHFDRLYFHGLRMADLGTAPLLILNATDYYRSDRAAFYKPDYDLDSLAGLVASSGAFPVAFDPVRVGGSVYSDGGIVENLGVEGLRHYLQAHPRAPQPDVLLISDASAEPRTINRVPKPTFFEEASGALEAQFIALNRRIFSLYAGQDSSNVYDRDSGTLLVQPYIAQAGSLWRGRTGVVKVFVLSPTSPAELPRFSADKGRIARVASMSTLHEPSAQEANDAFWAGATLTAAYLPQICQAVASRGCGPQKLTSSGRAHQAGRAMAGTLRDFIVGASVFALVAIALFLVQQRRLQLRLVNDCVKLALQTSIILATVYLAFIVASQMNYLPH